MKTPVGTEPATIRLDQFLKWMGAAQTGGEAKLYIQDGEVEVNGELETRRGRQLREGDRVNFAGRVFLVPPLQGQ